MSVLKRTGNRELKFGDNDLFAMMASKLMWPNIEAENYKSIRRTLNHHPGRLIRTTRTVNGRFTIIYSLPPSELPLNSPLEVEVPTSCRVRDLSTGTVHVMAPHTMLSHAICRKIKARAEIEQTSSKVTCRTCTRLVEYIASFPTIDRAKQNEENNKATKPSELTEDSV